MLNVRWGVIPFRMNFSSDNSEDSIQRALQVRFHCQRRLEWRRGSAGKRGCCAQFRGQQTARFAGTVLAAFLAFTHCLLFNDSAADAHVRAADAPSPAC